MIKENKMITKSFTKEEIDYHQNQNIYHCEFCYCYGTHTAHFVMTRKYPNSLNLWVISFPCIESAYDEKKIFEAVGAICEIYQLPVPILMVA
jgi:hypothetical protein